MSRHRKDPEAAADESAAETASDTVLDWHHDTDHTDHADHADHADHPEHDPDHEPDDEHEQLDIDDLAGHGHPERRRKRGRTLLALLAALVVVVLAGYAAFVALRPVVNGFLEEDDYAGPGTGEVVVQITAGETGRAIGDSLVEAGVVKTRQAFVDATRSEPDAGSIQPGSYRLREQMTGAAALASLLDPSTRVTNRVTVPEGLRLEDLVALLVDRTGLPAADFETALANPASIDLHPAAQGDAEGFLFPATYDIEPDATAVSVLTQMTDRFETALVDAGVPAGKERQITIIASLIQAEARRAEDFPLVSRVIYNRLAQGGRLELDSTVLYAAGEKSVTTTAEQRASDSPYNTYRVTGLPAGPIDAPGAEALAAAVAPADGPWLFFVTVDPDTGETLYATTLAEHQQNVLQFQQWLRDNG